MRKSWMMFLPVMLLTFALAGCSSYSVYQMEVLRPAEVTIPPQIKSVMVVDNSFPMPDSVEVEITTNSTYTSFVKGSGDSASSLAIRQLVSELNNRHFFDTVYLAPKTMNGKYGYRGKPVNVKELQKLTESKNVDAAIVLNGYNYNPSVRFLPTDVFGQYLCRQSLPFAAEWLFVDVNTGAMVDKHIHADTLNWQGLIDGYYYPVPGIPLLNEGIAEAAGHMAYAQADRIAPYWESISRFYYTSGAGYYPLAAKHVRKNEWVEAEKVWFYIYNHSKGVAKARLAHNIALAKEVEGDFENAARWSYQSWQLFNEKSSWYAFEASQEKKYYLELTKRYADAKKLADQYGTPVQ